MRTINKDKIILIGILSLAFFLRFYNIDYSDFTGDEAIVVAKALGIVRAGSYYRRTPFLDDVVNFWTLSIILKHHHPPMEITAHIPVLVFFGVTEFVARMPYLFSGVISVLIFYKIAKELFGTMEGHIAALLSAITGYFIAFSRHVQFEGLFLLFSLFTAYYSIKFYQSNALKDSGFAAFFFSMTLLSHHFAIFFAFPLIYLLFQKLYDKSLGITELLVPLTILAFATLPFFIPWVLAPYYLPNLVPPGTGAASTSQRALPSLYFNFFMFKNWLRYSPSFFYIFLLYGVSIALWLRNWKSYFSLTWFLAYFIPLTFLIKSKPTYTFILLAPLVILAAFGIKKSYLAVISRIRRADRIKQMNIIAVSLAVCFISLSLWNNYLTFLQYEINPTSAPLFFNSSYKTETDSPYGATYGRKMGYKAAGWFVRHNSHENDVIFGDDTFKVAYYCDRLIKGDMEDPEDFEELKRELPKNLFILFPSHLINQYTEIWDFARDKYNLLAIVTVEGQPTIYIFGSSSFGDDVSILNTEEYEELFDEEYSSIESSLHKYFGGSYEKTMI